MANPRDTLHSAVPPADELDMDGVRRRAEEVAQADQSRQHRTCAMLATAVLIAGGLTVPFFTSATNTDVAVSDPADGTPPVILAVPERSPVPSVMPGGEICSRPSPGPDTDVYLVQPGDTLAGIANEVYGDPTMFSIIAEANGFDGSQANCGYEALIIPALPPAPDDHPTGGHTYEVRPGSNLPETPRASPSPRDQRTDGWPTQTPESSPADSAPEPDDCLWITVHPDGTTTKDYVSVDRADRPCDTDLSR